jgi:hypothetical protein
MELPEGSWALLHEGGEVSLRRCAAPPHAPIDEPEERPASERDAVLAALLARPDPVVRDRLVAIGRGFSWHAAGCGETAARIDALRDDLARAPVFGSLLSSPLLPESAANVARQLEPWIEGGEVLVHEGQALVGVALARAGHAVTLWTRDPALAAFTASRDDLTLPVVADSPLEPLGGDRQRRFSLVLVDTLHDDDGLALLLSRAHHALRDGGRVVALGHPMQRDRLQTAATTAGLALAQPLDEIAVRLLCGFSPAEFVWDERVFERAGEPDIAADKTLRASAARDLDPTERKHGCVEVLALAADGMASERLDRALSLFAASERTPPLGTCAFDEPSEQHVRHVALGAGGHAALTVRPGEGRCAVDVFPWSPARLLRLCAALLTELPRAAEEVPLGR